MSDETILFTPVPECNDLLCMECRITSLDVTDEIKYHSLFHCQILICRSFLSSFPDVISAPVPQTDNYIYLIAKKKCFQTDEMMNFLKMKKLYYSDPQPVTYDTYKECVKYTMMFKLAPSWNKFGVYSCHGQYFLIGHENLDAVKFDVDIKKLGMIIKFQSTKLKVNPLKVEELGLSSSLLAEFKQNPQGVIHLGQHWANVLPSLIKARILKVSKRIPKTCFEGNYQSLRRHWENMYGYILPERSEGILFYEVRFTGFPEQIFVYPDICLQSDYPKMIPCKNQSLICIQFVEGLRNEVRAICEQSISLVKLNPKVIKETPNPNFRPAREIKIEKTNSQIPRLPSIYGTVTPKQNFTNVPKLKQQTINFPSVKLEPSSPRRNVNSANISKNGVTKLKTPELPNSILSQISQSTPLKRKLIIDPKVEKDNISIKSETFEIFMNLIKSNETQAKNEIEKKTSTTHPLLQRKPDICLPKLFPPPTKRVRIPQTDPPETITKYFKQQKSNLNRPAVTQGKLQLKNLPRYK